MIDLEVYNSGKPFKITEKGVFAVRPIGKQRLLGPAYLLNWDGTSGEKSFLTQYLRDSESPNVVLEEESPRVFVFRVIEGVVPGDELLIDHRTYPWYQA